MTSTLASSRPATSANVIFTRVPLSNKVAFDLPILKIPPPPGPPPAPPPILRIINTQIATNNKMGRINCIAPPIQSLSLSTS